MASTTNSRPHTGIREEVRSSLRSAGLLKIDEDVLSKCTCLGVCMRDASARLQTRYPLTRLCVFFSSSVVIALSESLNVSPSAIAECWEAYSLTKHVKTLDTHSFPAFRLKLMKDVDNPIALASIVNDDKNSAVRVTAYKRDMSSVVITPAHLNNKKRPTSSSSGGGQSTSSESRRVSLSPSAPVLSFSSTATISSSVPQQLTYGERQGAGKVVMAFNPSARTVAPSSAIESGATDTSRARPKCTISTNFDTNVSEPYRHWFTVLDDRALELDLQLQQHSDLLNKQYNFGSDQIAALEAIGVPRQETICCIGRICNAVRYISWYIVIRTCDYIVPQPVFRPLLKNHQPKAHEGRINATSVLLEGSRHMSGGARVEVDLSFMKSNKLSYSLFPGQIVAIEGMNCSGRKLVAQRICEGAPHARVQTPVADLMKFHHGDKFQSGAPLKVAMASGPFTCSDNLEYEPLIDLVNTIMVKSKPDVVILAGPFVDTNQKSVASGDTFLSTGNGDEKILVPYETIFSLQISRLLEELYLDDASRQTQFILVPSLDDATSESVYPQAPFQVTAPVQLGIPGGDLVEVGTIGIQAIENANRQPGLKYPQRVHCVSNPSTFQVNEVVFGVTSTDILFHMSADETNGNLEIGTRMSRIAQHLVQQRSYYPLFPASANTNLNLKYMNHWQMPCTPDVLILPSKLSPFCAPVLDNGTLVINPGHLARANMGGTYAIMDIYPIAREVLENAGGDDVQLSHGIHDRTYVEIKRI